MPHGTIFDTSSPETDPVYRLIFDRVADAVFLHDQETHRFLDCNQTALKRYGYSRQELLQMTPFDLHPADEIDRVEVTINVRNPDVPNIYRHVSKDGELFWVEILTDAIEFEGRPAWLSIVRDITQRQQMTEELAQNRALLEAIVQSTADGIMVSNDDGTLLFANENLRRMWDLPEELLQSRNLQDILPFMLDQLREPKAHRERVEALRNSREISTVDLERVDGQVFEHHSRPLNRSGVSCGRVCSFRNVTPRRRFERKLQEARDAALEASRMKSEFLANMSHEIRTPMNGVLGMAQLLLQTELSGEQQEYAEVIQTSADSLLGLINDILDLSKIEAGKLELEPRPNDVEELVVAALRLHENEARERGLALGHQLAAGTPTRVEVDGLRLRQILTNLVSNAIKFTPQGSVTVNVSGAAEKGRAKLRLEVVDTGIGIAADKLEGIFEKFTQADASTTRRYGGSGLGLAICRELAGKMGGALGAVSEEGKGSTFWVTFDVPLAE